jgi:RHS repeat-associated protein
MYRQKWGRFTLVRAVVSSTGTAGYTWPWLDNAFGEQSMQGPGAFYLRFPGQYYDVETGLSFNNNRNYDPTTGRYLQSDSSQLPDQRRCQLIQGKLEHRTYITNQQVGLVISI